MTMERDVPKMPTLRPTLSTIMVQLICSGRGKKGFSLATSARDHGRERSF